MLSLYKSLVRPHLEYGNTIWSPKLKRVIKSLESVQRRATKMVPSLANLSYPERLKELNLPTLVYRRRRGVMIQAFKIFHNIYDVDSGAFFQMPNDVRTRGHPYKVFKERAVTPVRRNFFSCRLVDLWNDLPQEVVTYPDIEIFVDWQHTFYSAWNLPYSNQAL